MFMDVVDGRACNENDELENEFYLLRNSKEIDDDCNNTSNSLKMMMMRFGPKI